MSSPTAFINLLSPAAAGTLEGQNERLLSGLQSIFQETYAQKEADIYKVQSLDTHHVDAGHFVEISKSFKILNIQRTANLLRFTAEAITAIKRFRANLCTQTERVQSVSHSLGNRITFITLISHTH
ncbi:unnamed protein product [Trichobilharzia szidati]|nr:unnamed protein product [Trichobilharzia szidati]